MLDGLIRPLLDRPLDAAAAWLTPRGVTADALTGIGLVIGLVGACALGFGASGVGLAALLANRCADGLDGAVARRAGVTDRGGFIDIVADFLIYAAYPLAFAVADPARNALPAAFLLASFIPSGVTFLAFAAIAAKRGLVTQAQGTKSIYYLAGLVEGFETIVALAAMCWWPQAFPTIAIAFAALCAVSTAIRIAMGWHTLSACRE